MVANSQGVKGRAKQRERTRRLILDAALGLMQRGTVPTVEEAAAAADVSPATGYRYFASQDELVAAALFETFRSWDDEPLEGDDVDARIDAVIDAGFPRMFEFEAAHRAGLRLAMDQWIRKRAGDELREPPLQRGGRRRGVDEALAPVRNALDKKTLRRLEAALGLMLGIETVVVMHDMFELKPDEVREAARWACKALVRAALEVPAKSRKTSSR